jgi:hypothetical protein
MSSQSDLPSTSELIDGISFFPIALVVSATIFPGLTICIPGLILGAAFIVIPLAAVAIVLLLVAAVVAAPFLAVRGVRALVRRRAEAREQITVEAPAPAAFVPPRFTTAALQRLTAGPPVRS